MNNGVSFFCILLLIYLIIAGLLLMLGYDVTNKRLIIFISLVAMISSLIDLLNVFKSKAENELIVVRKVYRIKDGINRIKGELEQKYDYGSNLFEDYINQVFDDLEKKKIYQNELTEKDKESYCEKVSSYKFDNTKLKEMIKEFINIKISDDVKMVAEEEDYTQIDDIKVMIRKKISIWKKRINIVISIGVFNTSMIVIYFDAMSTLFPNLDMNISIFSFIVVICTIIIREHQNFYFKDIKNDIDEILSEIQRK